jgi:hypothetical protein
VTNLVDGQLIFLFGIKKKSMKNKLFSKESSIKKIDLDNVVGGANESNVKYTDCNVAGTEIYDVARCDIKTSYVDIVFTTRNDDKGIPGAPGVPIPVGVPSGFRTY